MWCNHQVKHNIFYLHHEYMLVYTCTGIVLNVCSKICDISAKFAILTLKWPIRAICAHMSIFFRSIIYEMYIFYDFDPFFKKLNGLKAKTWGL